MELKLSDLLLLLLLFSACLLRELMVRAVRGNGETEAGSRTENEHVGQRKRGKEKDAQQSRCWECGVLLSC
ncbi:hypothetical protein SRHO_G00323770 [Serrasalmus rhombeus]